MNETPGIAFANLPLAAPAALQGQLTAALRIDPYWAELWGFGARAAWARHKSLVLREQQGLEKLYARDRNLSPKEARQIVLAPDAFDEPTLQVLAADLMWRTLTAEQIATIVGDPHIAGRSKHLRLAFVGDLLERGRCTAGAYREKFEPKWALYRPVPSRRNSGAFAQLAHPIRVRLGVADGDRWVCGSQSERHNLLTAELALRVAEYTQVAAVVGESMATVGHLVTDPAALTTRQLSRTADAAITRHDGMRIAIELTANTNQKFAHKVESWLEILRSLAFADRDNPHGTEVCVLFVEAARDEVSNKQDRAIHKALNAALDELVPYRRRQVADRIAYVRWRDWFPREREAAPDFTGLICKRPTGPDSARWEPASLLDESDLQFSPHDPFVATGALEQLSLKWGVPHWLRNESLVDAAYHQHALSVLAAYGWPPTER